MVKDFSKTPGEEPIDPREPVQVKDVLKMLGDMKEQGMIDPAVERRRRFQVLDGQTKIVQRTLAEAMDELEGDAEESVYTPEDIQDLRAEVLDLTARRAKLGQEIEDPEFMASIEEGSADYLAEIDKIFGQSGPTSPPEQP